MCSSFIYYWLSACGFHDEIECVLSSFIPKDLAVNLDLVTAFNSALSTVVDSNSRHALDFSPDSKLGLDPDPVLKFNPGPGSHPRVASLRNASTGSHVCSATLVSAHAAVTAAHCAHAQPLYLQLNNYCAPDVTEPPTAAICDVYVHKNYNKYTRAHDLAVLSIDLNLDNKTWLDEDILPKSTFGLSGTCMIAGYGVNDVNSNETSEILRGSFAKIISLDECTDRLGAFMAPQSQSGMICAVGDCTDACQGDSGGPLLCDGVLEGVTSYGLSCGVRDVPAVYTGLRGHLFWLRKKISMLNQMNMKI